MYTVLLKLIKFHTVYIKIIKHFSIMVVYVTSFDRIQLKDVNVRIVSLQYK